MIVAENLTKNFQGTQAVKNVSFELERGRRLILLGTSGSGKTTTLRMLNRLIEPNSGDVFINGTSILKQNAITLRRNIGYVLQHHGLFPHYSVEENISIVPQLLNWDKARIRNRCVELLEKFHMPASEFLRLMPDKLSGGQQQRVGLARALAADPPILLMDEPFGALDPLTRTKIRRNLIQVDELSDKTIVLVTHDVQEAFELGDRICLLHQGTIMQIGSAVELLFNPNSEFVQNFFSAQRLELEMQVLRITDLWQFLAGSTNEEEGSELPATSKISELLSYFSASDKSSVKVFHRELNERKTINASGIFQALNQRRKSAGHE